MAFLTEAANRGSISTGYDIDYSLKLEPDNSESLTYTGTQSSAGNAKTWTWSGWIKRTELDAHTYLFSAGYTGFQFMGTENWLRLELYNGSTTYYLDLDMVFRDTSAWYHIVGQVDTTQATAADRVKIWINGVLQTEFRASTNYTNISQNAEFQIGKTGSSANWLKVGDWYAGGRYLAAYIAEWHYTDGVANDADAFGKFDDNGIWVPKEYAGSYGTNGYYLDFSDSANLGDDANGSFSFTEGNITAADQATDTPTNNFCTVRPMWTPHEAACSLLEGATVWKINMPSGSGFQPNTSAISTFQFNSGKWYWETTWTNDGDRSVLGIVSSLSDIEQTVDPDRYIWWDGGHIPWNFSGSGSNDLAPPNYDSNNTIGIALDMDNDRIAFSKDGGWLDSSGNTSDSSPGYFYSWSSTTFLSHAKANGNVAAFFGINTNANTVAPTHNINFGGYAATIRTSGGNSDANGYGNFAYSVPSGFYAACTKNLAEYGG